MNKILYIFPAVKDFREDRPAILWEEMYGWIDGYAMLFDPVIAAKFTAVPEWSCGAPEEPIGVEDFLITSSSQATAELKNLDHPGIYIRPKAAGARSRSSEKEYLQWGKTELAYPYHLKLDIYDASMDTLAQFQLGGERIVCQKGGGFWVGIEFFSMFGTSFQMDFLEKQQLFGVNMLLELLDVEQPEIPGSCDDLRLDFQAYGAMRWLIQWMLIRNAQAKNRVSVADSHYLLALKEFQTGEYTNSKTHLRHAFAALRALRYEFYSTRIRFIEYPHMGILWEDGGFFEIEHPEYTRKLIEFYLEKAEKYQYRFGIEAGASCWRQLFNRYPGLQEKVLAQVAQNNVDIVNGTWSLPYAWISPLALQYWQFSFGQKQLRELFGSGAQTYQCQENSFTPQLPELLRHFDFDYAIHVTQNHGSTTQEDEPFIQWQSYSGDGIEALTCKNNPLAKKGVNYFFDLPIILDEVAQEEEFNYFNFMDIYPIPLRHAMIRANKYAEIFGTFVNAKEIFAGRKPEKKLEKRKYSLDSYKFSESFFYSNFTNLDSFSQPERIFSTQCRYRQLMLLNGQFANPHGMIETFCSTEAHDCDVVQGQRRGEFYRKTNDPTPATRDTLQQAVQEKSREIHSALESLDTHGGEFLSSTCELDLDFAFIRNPERYSGSNRIEFNGRVFAVNHNIISGKSPMQITRDGANLLIEYRSKKVRFALVDKQYGYFKLLDFSRKEAGALTTYSLLYESSRKPLEIVRLSMVSASRSDLVDIRIEYASGAHFDSNRRLDDYLAAELVFEEGDCEYRRFNPNILEKTRMPIVCSPCMLEYRRGDQKIALLNGGAPIYTIDYEKNIVHWLFHVDGESRFERGMAIFFGEENSYCASKAWLSGLVATAKPYRPPVALPDGVCCEGFVAANTLLVSNLGDTLIDAPLPQGVAFMEMAQKVNMINRLILKPFQTGLIKI